VNGLRLLENGVDEQALVAAAQCDPSRFAELYEMNFGRVYAFVSRRVASRQDAEDLTAEVFHEALRNLARFEWRGLPFAAWLLGIAAHMLADRWRNAAKRTSILGEVPDQSHSENEQAGSLVLDPASVGARMTDSKIEQCAILYELVDELPPDQQLIIVRRFVDQKSVRDIAVELGRSEGAVKQLQFRAMQNLSTRMGRGREESVRSSPTG
jgi:RNA polymerase sigma-70 factor (ECF subfamily)